MISIERLKWLQENKKHGDISAVVKQLNPKGSKKGISNTEALAIINGNLWGKHGAEFCNALEKLIKKRNRILKLESKRYATAS